jgi:FtsH-binding integral membrane protein
MSNAFAMDYALETSVERKNFIRKVYLHLLGAIAAFVALEYAWFATPVAQSVFSFVGRVNWLVILGIFMGTAWLATRLANPDQSKALQYGGLLLYVFIQSLIFIPMLVIAQYYGGEGVIARSAYMTLGGFTALTSVVLITKVNLSSWGRYLAWAGILALMAVVCGAIFGFELGTYFSLAMVAFAGFAILHDTSKILHSHNEEAYVGASLQLFASVALMFWYLLRLSSRK